MKIIIYSLSIIIAYISFGTILWGRHTSMMPLTFLFCFFLAFLIRRSKWNKDKSIWVYTSPVILFSLILIFMEVLNFLNEREIFVYSLPYILFIPLCFYLGGLFFRTKKFIYPILTVLILYLNNTYVFPNSFSYFSTSNVTVNTNMPNIEFVNESKEVVKLPKDKVIILDFWSTFCGVCYKKFPLFEKVYQEYKDNPNIEFYAIHVSYKNDEFEETIHLLDEYKYTFPLLYALDKDEVEKKLNISAFPTVAVIKNGVIRYRGQLIVNKNVVFGNTISQIKELLSE